MKARRHPLGSGTAIAAALAALIAACFSDKTATAPPGSDVNCEIPLELIEAGHTIVAIRNFAFFPNSIEVEAGTTVTWFNCEPPNIDAHTSTSDDGIWGSELLPPGATFTRTFEEPGVFPYFCVPHPFMRARVVVVE